MKLLGEYRNGNYKVEIYEDGTKLRETQDDEFIAEFPECIDLKITNQCDMNCKYCHENSTIDGLHGDILDAKFIDTLRPYTELALGGGNPLAHPDLVEFLNKLKEKNIIANVTVNQTHFIKQQELVRYLVDNDLIKGLGVSLLSATDEFTELVQQYKNLVIHVINGVVKLDDLKKLYNLNLKILILGYKQFRRGKDFYSEVVETSKKEIYDNMIEIIKKFQTVSFDNRGLRQLDIKRLMTEEQWNEFYMGDDGSHTMYIDLVDRMFALNSTTEDRHELLDNINEMFKLVK